MGISRVMLFQGGRLNLNCNSDFHKSLSVWLKKEML